MKTTATACLLLLTLLFARLPAHGQATLTVLPATLAGFTTAVGTPSAEQNTLLNGSGLTGTVTATAPAGFEVSWMPGTSFGGSVVLTQSGGVATNVPLYVRLTGAVLGSISGTIGIASPGAATQTVAVSGTVTAAPMPNPVCSLTRVDPTSGPGGTVQTISLHGRNFVPGATASFPYAIVIGTTYVSPTLLTALIDVPSVSSPVTLTINAVNPPPGGGISQPVLFTLLPAPPVITRFAPSSGPVGTQVVINGTNLSPSGAGFNTFFNGAPGASVPRVPQPTEVYTLVPPGATTGLITLTNPNGAAVSAGPFTVTPSPPAFFEDFETGTKTSYAPASVALASGGWTLAEALIGTAAGVDKFNGTRAARLRGGGFVEMDTDKPNGAGVVTVSAASYATESGASFVPEISTDGGVTYRSLLGNSPPPVLTGTLTPYSFPANRVGNVRLRFSSTNTAPTTTPRLNLDDIGVTDYRPNSALAPGAARPEVAVFPNPTQGWVTVLGLHPGKAAAGLYDLAGRALAPRTELAADRVLRLPPLPAGLYLLRFEDAAGQRTVRLAVE